MRLCASRSLATAMLCVALLSGLCQPAAATYLKAQPRRPFYNTSVAEAPSSVEADISGRSTGSGHLNGYGRQRVKGQVLAQKSRVLTRTTRSSSRNVEKKEHYTTPSSEGAQTEGARGRKVATAVPSTFRANKLGSNRTLIGYQTNGEAQSLRYIADPAVASAESADSEHVAGADDFAAYGKTSIASTFRHFLRSHGPRYVTGAVVLLAGIFITLLSELRGARLGALAYRGTRECRTVSCDLVDKATRGHLVHTQGYTRAAVNLADPRFPDLEIAGCLKVQSTLEALEHVPIVQTVARIGDGTWPSASETPKRHVCTRVEWTPAHHSFREPSSKKPTLVPETPLPGGYALVGNPDLPVGLTLGTVTTTCGRVEMGGFVVPEELVSRLQRYELASGLPDIVRSHGMSFHANRDDGYYYARPSLHFKRSGASIVGSGASGARDRNVLDNHQVGDLRARFLVVPQGKATIVGVQGSVGDSDETFVPYRSIASQPCVSEADHRKLVVDEGALPLREFLGQQQVSMCCAFEKGQVTSSSVCCLWMCPCNVITCLLGQEVVTEEIFFMSDRFDTQDAAFRQVVPRNHCRVNCYRFVCWCGLLAGLVLLLGPLLLDMKHAIGLEGAYLVLPASLATALFALITAVASVYYMPSAALQLTFISVLFFALPLTLARYQHFKSL